jgi:hypothetical protein
MFRRQDVILRNCKIQSVHLQTQRARYYNIKMNTQKSDNNYTDTQYTDYILSGPHKVFRCSHAHVARNYVNTWIPIYIYLLHQF